MAESFGADAERYDRTAPYPGAPDFFQSLSGKIADGIRAAGTAARTTPA